MTDDDGPMTRVERMDLIRIVKLNAGIAKGDIEAVAASRKANVEDQLAREFQIQDERWRAIISDAQAQVDEAKDQIAKVLAEAGVPEQFRPKLSLIWFPRGENSDPKRRAELRRLAYTRIESDAKNAKATISRAEVENTAGLLASGITSAEGLAALARIPTPEQLIPSIDVRELEAARVELHNRLNGRYDARAALSEYGDDLGFVGGKQHGDDVYDWYSS